MFPKGIYPKVNEIARLEYELAYYDSAVHRFNHYTTKTPTSNISFWDKHFSSTFKVRVTLLPTFLWLFFKLKLFHVNFCTFVLTNVHLLFQVCTYSDFCALTLTTVHFSLQHYPCPCHCAYGVATVHLILTLSICHGYCLLTPNKEHFSLQHYPCPCYCAYDVAPVHLLLPRAYKPLYVV